MTTAFSKQQMLNLYRTVLQLHRRVLPQEMRELGDKYVRSEFKAHKTAKIGQVKEFARQWKEYAYTIDLQAQKGQFGKDLDPKKQSFLNDDQRENLKRLEQEARKIGEQAP
eukprot:CAMPEP_0181334578 /NCGR_PEP_ID=MMETSP1101-20121128/26343_1 /TAXON_ID=46948 /ORGANISM="Rhodomonas abbreviata, Strain Caron Lab Isolate" /LENGTH=110 /DNA_ID=CAMNT_0023444581 /DNA_START=9 /DNA_END=341 /DNA_ORIENTATION=+